MLDLQNGELFIKFQINFPQLNQLNLMLMHLARYAALVQEAKMVPIVEPEVLMDGDIILINAIQSVTTNVLNECYNELKFTKLI